MECSVSNLLNLTHWWNWQSSITTTGFPERDVSASLLPETPDRPFASMTILSLMPNLHSGIPCFHFVSNDEFSKNYIFKWFSWTKKLIIKEITKWLKRIKMRWNYDENNGETNIQEKMKHSLIRKLRISYKMREDEHSTDHYVQFVDLFNRRQRQIRVHV